MKIIKKGVSKEVSVLKNCIGKQVKCDKCGSVLEIENGDKIFRENDKIENVSKQQEVTYYSTQCVVCACRIYVRIEIKDQGVRKKEYFVKT